MTPPAGAIPALSDEVNVQATRGLVADAGEAGVQRLVFASTCSNYGRMADPTVPITEDGELSPVSLYAEQKVSMEKLILGGETSSVKPTCLRFATVYGVGRRMRFDLTVNEFTRDLWGDRELEVFGEQFWRPYIHVRDAGRAVLHVLEAPPRRSLTTSSTPAARARTTASSISSRRSASRSIAARSPTSSATRTRATTRSASTRSARSSASRR